MYTRVKDLKELSHECYNETTLNDTMLFEDLICMWHGMSPQWYFGANPGGSGEKLISSRPVFSDIRVSLKSPVTGVFTPGRLASDTRQGSPLPFSENQC